MADSTEILKEYLIKVGLKADYDSLSKFGGIAGTIGKMVGGMAGALSAGIGALEGFVAVASSELEDLYWATKRLRSSASDIQDFQLKMQKAGATAGAARQALETIAAFRRSNPAGDAFIGLMGVNTQGKGATEVMDGLIDRFKKLNAQGQYWLAVRFGERLGLDEATVYQMVQATGELDKRFAKMYKGFNLNADEAAKKAHLFENRLRDLKADSNVLSTAIEVRLLPVADRFIKWLEKSIEESGKAGTPMNALAKAFDKIGTALDDLSGVVKLLGTLATVVAQLVAWMPPDAIEFGVVGYLLFGKKAALVMAAIGGLSHLGDLWLGRAEENKPFTDKDTLDKAGKGGDYGVNRWLNDHGLGFLNTNSFNATYEEYKKQQRESDVPSFGGGGGGSSGGQGGPLGVRSNNPGNLQPGGKEAVYRNPLDGLQHMARQLQRYSSRGLNSIASIISTYAPPNANNTAAYISTVAQAMGVSSGAKLNMSDPGTMQRLMSAMIKVEQGYAPYSQGLIGQAIQSVMGGSKSGGFSVGGPPSGDPFGSRSPLGGGGGRSVTVHQGDTNVTIHNAKDPKATGDAVGRVSDRTNGDLVRNLSSALT